MNHLISLLKNINNMEKEVKIRKATPKDTRRISILRRQTLEKINKHDYPKPALEILKKNYSSKSILERMKRKKMFVLTIKSRIVGSVELNQETGRVQGLYVDYKHLGKGYGLKLMEFVEKYALANKINKIILYSTKTAYPFYKKLGYKLVKSKRTFWEGPGFKVKDLFMEKRLNKK